MRGRALGSAALAAGAGYLLGSIPSAELAARHATAGRIHLSSAGSGNPGALNAIQVLGSRWGVVVGLADLGKGVAASLVGRAIAGDVGAHIGGTAAVVGHCYPVWSGFRGGKGMACACGQGVANFPTAVPIEAAAAAVGMVTASERRSYVATLAVLATSVAASVVWWWRGWPNAWGPRPTLALPVATALSSAVVLRRFAGDRAGRFDRSVAPRT